MSVTIKPNKEIKDKINHITGKKETVMKIAYAKLYTKDNDDSEDSVWVNSG